MEGVDTEDSGSGQLHMTAVHRQDAGTYSATATSPHGALNTSFTINVLCECMCVFVCDRVNMIIMKIIKKIIDYMQSKG